MLQREETSSSRDKRFRFFLAIFFADADGHGLWRAAIGLAALESLASFSETSSKASCEQRADRLQRVDTKAYGLTAIGQKPGFYRRKLPLSQR
jgi:hypothetical protein